MSGNDIWTIPNDDRRSIRVDLPFANIRYVGRATSVNAATSEPIWMIRREYKNGTETVIEFANFSSYSAVWNDRATYFSAAIGDDDNPLDVAPSSGGGGGKISEYDYDPILGVGVPWIRRNTTTNVLTHTLLQLGLTTGSTTPVVSDALSHTLLQLCRTAGGAAAVVTESYTLKVRSESNEILKVNLEKEV